MEEIEEKAYKIEEKAYKSLRTHYFIHCSS